MRICFSRKIKRIAHSVFQCYAKQKINLACPKIIYKWKKSAVSRGCSNAANTSKRATHSVKGSRNNTSIIEIWKQFITMEMVNLTFHYIKLKINAFLDTLESHIMLAQLKQRNCSIFLVFLCLKFTSS